MNHPHTTTSRPTTEWTLLIFEALQKAVEIIWRARLPVPDQPQSVVQPPQPGHASSSSSSSSSSRRSRLNLEVEEVEYVRQRMSGWKETLHTPVVVDLYFVETDPLGRTYKDLVERWYLFFDPTTGPGSPLSSKRDASASAAAASAHLKRAQKRLTFMLRTLYSFLRMAPPFQLVRRLSEAAPDCTSHLEANLNPGLASGLREDMTRLLEDGETYQTYRFTDISTPYGTLKATVVYRTQCDFEVATRPSPAPLIQPSQIIEGYVQGPRADQPPPPPQPSQPRGASGLTRAMQLHEAQNQQQHRQPQPPQPVVQQQPRHRPPMHPPSSPQDRHMYHQRRSSAPSASPPFRHHHHGHASDPRDIPGGMAEDRNHHHHQQLYGRSFKSTSPLGRLDGDLRARSLDSAIPTLMKDYRVGLERGSSAGFTASTYRPDSHRYGSSPQSPLLGLTTSRTKGFTPPSSASGWQMMQDDRRSVPQHIRRYSSSSLPDDPPVEEDEDEEEEETTRATRGRVVGESPHSTPLRPGVTPSSLSTPPFSSSYTNTVENEAIPPFSLGCSPPFASHLSSLLSRSPQQPPPPSPPFMRNPASADSNYNQRTHCLPVNTGLGSFTTNPNTTTPTFSSSAGRYTGGFASSTSPSMDMVRVGGGGGSASTTPTKPLSGVTGGLSPSSYHMAYSSPIGPMLESLGDSPFKLSGNSASLLRPGSSSAFGGLSSKYSNTCPSSGSISQGGGSRLSNRPLALTSFECMEGEARAFKKPLGLGLSQGPRPMTSDTGAYVNDATGDAEEDLPFAARGPPEPLQSTSRPSSSFTQTSVPLSLSTPAPMVNTSISTLRVPRFTTSSTTTTGGSSVLSTTPTTASSLNLACSQQQAGGLGLLDALEEDLRSFRLFRDEFNRPLPQPHTTDH